MTDTKTQPKGRTLTGTVVSDKMTKTVVVEITHLKMNPKYKKQFKSSQKYKVHDEKGEFHVGDRIVIRETRPMSKEKRWIAVGKAA